jgi:type III restriction enzyme
MELRGVEKAKIACAKKLFNDASTSDVRFGVISNYDELLNIIQ